MKVLPAVSFTALTLLLFFSLASTILIPENLASARTPLYDAKGYKCDLLGLNCEQIFWEITLRPSPELVNADTGEPIWNYTPGLAAEYAVNIVAHPKYNLSNSDIRYYLQISSGNGSESGITYQITSGEVKLDADLIYKQFRIPVQINQTGTYYLELFFLANSASDTPVLLSYPKGMTIPVNGCMCDFGGAYPEDYLAAYPSQRIEIISGYFYDIELEEHVAQGYADVPMVFDTRLSNNGDASQDYIYIVSLINLESNKTEHTLTFEGTIDGRRNVELNETVTFEKEGDYLIRGQVFDASSIKDGSGQQSISGLYVERIDIEPASEREIEKKHSPSAGNEYFDDK